MNNDNGIDFFNTMNGGHWGNASNWDNNATTLGYIVDTTPARGAIAQWNADEGCDCPYGHVAWVSTVNANGSVVVEEYNYSNPYAYGTRTVTAPRYIHVADLSIGSCAKKSWLFNTDGNREGWGLANASDAVLGGSWIINPGSDSQCISPLLGCGSATANYLRLGIRNKGGDEDGQVFFSAPGLGYSESRSRWFDNPNNGTVNWVTVRLDDIEGWGSASSIDRIRIDPVRNGVPVSGTDDIVIDYIFLRMDNANPTQPVITSVSPPGWENQNSFTVTFTGNDPPPWGFDDPTGPDVYGSGVYDFRYRVTPNGDAAKAPDTFDDRTGTATATVTVQATKQGANEFVVYSFDKTGHPSVARTATLYYDSVAPSAPCQPSVTPSEYTATNSFTFSWCASTDATSGINRYQYRIDSGTTVNLGNVTSVSGITAPSAGPHSFQVRAVDNAGNASVWSTSRSFYYDNVAPTVPGKPTAAPPTWTATNSFSFSWTASTDSYSGLDRYQYRIDSGSAVNLGTATTVNGIVAPSAGSHAFQVRAVDNLENTSAWSTGCAFYYDNVSPTAPGVPVASPAGYTNENDYAVSWTAGSDLHSGVDGYEYRVNGGEIKTTTELVVSGPFATHEGANAFEVRTRDEVGNVSSWQPVALYYDATAPAVVLPVVEPAACSPQNDFAVHWDPASDPQGIARYEYRVGGEGAPILQTEMTSVGGIVATRECGEDFEVRAVDGVGNTGSWGAANICYDGSPPSAPEPSVSPAAWSRINDFALTWTAGEDSCTGLAGYCVRVGIAAPDTCVSDSLVGGLRARFEGVDTAYVASRDGVGNLSDFAAALLRYDATVPETAMPPLPGVVSEDSALVSWSAVDSVSGVSKFDVQYRDSLDVDWHDWLIETTEERAWFGPQQPLGPERGHMYAFRVRATDNAGNMSVYSEEGDVVTRFAPTVDVASPMSVPRACALYPAVPNPFGAGTVVRFDLPQRSPVLLAVYDVAGRAVRTLVRNSDLGPGQEVALWDGRDDNGRVQPNGVYFIRFVVQHFSQTRRVVFLKP